MYKTIKEANVQDDEILIPLYKKYKYIEVEDDPCFECGHVDTYKKKVPDGEPYGFEKRKKGISYLTGDYYGKKLLDSLRDYYGKKLLDSLSDYEHQPVRFSRYKPLGEKEDTEC